jgi:hypothetical protein
VFGHASQYIWIIGHRLIMKIIWTLGLSILNPFLLFGSMFLAGGGHGDVSPLRFFYPAIWAFNIEQDSNLMWALLYAQFSFYGALIDFARAKSWGKPVGIGISFVHMMLFSMVGS